MQALNKQTSEEKFEESILHSCCKGLLDRYPIHNTSSVNVDINSVPLFCLPLGANLECRRTGSTNSDMNKSTFVLTQQNRDKLYGSAIRSESNTGCLDLFDAFYFQYFRNLCITEYWISEQKTLKNRWCNDNKIPLYFK